MTGDAVVQQLSDEQFERWMDLREREMAARQREYDRRQDLDSRVWALDKALVFHLKEHRFTDETKPTEEEVMATGEKFAVFLSADSHSSDAS